MGSRDRYLPPSGTQASSSWLREAPLIRPDPNSNLNRLRSSLLLEDRIEIQHREIQTLLADNQRLAVTHVALKEELTAAKREIQRLLETAAKVKAERDAQLREVYGKSLKMEAEVRVIDVITAELDQVREDVEKLAVTRRDLTTEMAGVDGDLAKVRTDSQRATEIKAEMETLRKEIQKGRKAIEFEKKTLARNLNHKHIMEKNMGLLACEIDKLQAELAKAEDRARIAAASTCPNPEFGASCGNPDMAFGGRPYTESYGMH